MGKKVSMQTIADKLNVTKVTVSKALNGKDGVGYDTKQKILSTAADLGYSIKRAEDKTKGESYAFLILSSFFEKRDEKFYTRIFSNLSNICIQNDCALQLVIVTAAEYENNIVPPALTAAMSGIFLCGEFCDGYILEILKVSKNLVAIDFSPKTQKLDCVVSDNYDLGYKAATYLIERGHRSIGFLGLPTKSISVCDRYYGYRKALFLGGIEFNPDYLVNNENMIADTYALDIALPKDNPTAYICNCDMAAYYFSQTLAAQKFAVGSDVSLISFDNTDISEQMTPKLTTFQIDKQQFASRAFKLMKRRVGSKQLAPSRAYSSFELIERDSIKTLH